MAMRQIADCVNQALDEGSDCYEQGREKEPRMHRDAQSDYESNQQRRSRWFGSGHEDFFHNASFSIVA